MRSYVDPETDEYANRESDVNQNTHADFNSDADSDCNPYSDTNQDAHSYANPNPNPDQNAHAISDSDPDGESDPHAHSAWWPVHLQCSVQFAILWLSVVQPDLCAELHLCFISVRVFDEDPHTDSSSDEHADAKTKRDSDWQSYCNPSSVADSHVPV